MKEECKRMCRRRKRKKGRRRRRLVLLLPLMIMLMIVTNCEILPYKRRMYDVYDE